MRGSPFRGQGGPTSQPQTLRLWLGRGCLHCGTPMFGAGPGAQHCRTFQDGLCTCLLCPWRGLTTPLNRHTPGPALKMEVPQCKALQVSTQVFRWLGAQGCAVFDGPTVPSPWPQPTGEPWEPHSLLPTLHPKAQSHDGAGELELCAEAPHGQVVGQPTALWDTPQPCPAWRCGS